MSLSARRLWGAVLLTVLMADPTTTVAAAPARTSPGIHAQAAATRHRVRRRGVRPRVRRPPPGGVYARNAVVIDPATDEVLYAKNALSPVPIASLSKMMTVLVFLERKPDLDRIVEVTRVEIFGAGHTRLRSHEMVSLGDLLHMSLMCSDNAATRVLVRESGLTAEDFQARMNRKAVDLGMSHTRFVEGTGLDQRNVSTAADCARLLRAAAQNDVVQDIMTTREYQFRAGRWSHHLVNTNRLLVYRRYDIRGGKTGFINEAGYCFATWIHTQGRDLIAVVLGAPTAATRFADVVRLVKRTTAPSVTLTN